MQPETQMTPEHSKVQELNDALQRIAQVNFVGFILEQTHTSAGVGGKVEFRGHLVNLSDSEVKLTGYGAGILMPRSLHGSAFPFDYNPELPQTLPKLSVFGPTFLFSMEIPHGSVRESDQILVGQCGPTYKEALDPSENSRMDRPAFFYIALTR